MRSVLAFAVLVGLAGAARGETVQIPTDTTVRIAITRPFTTFGGYCPLRVSIKNASSRSGEWTFDFTGYRGTGSTHRSQTVLAVASGEERSFDIVVPLATPPGEAGALHVRASGPGVENPTWEQPVLQHGYVQELQHWLAVSQSLHGETGLDPRNAFDPGLLPSDWRGYLSLNIVALTEDELAKATPEQRVALLEWVARGGILVRIGSDAPATEGYGLGTVVRAPRPSDPSKWGELFTVPGWRQRVSYDHWVRQSFADIAPQSGLLLVFLVVYAVLVGPVNLFVFCSKGRRARLFWTMPTMALAASVFLSVLILLQDGLGGSGDRISLVRLVPELTREAVIQEQRSRTGALLRRGFEIDEPVALFDVWTGASPSRLELVSLAGSFGGSWFRSRAIQVQRIEAVRPTRARVEWAGEGRIHSSVEFPLETLFYRDGAGRIFRASGLTPGGEATLQRSSEEEFQSFRASLMGTAGPIVRAHIDALTMEFGGFLALAADGASIDTLPGIEWNDMVIVSGRIGGRK